MKQVSQTLSSRRFDRTLFWRTALLSALLVLVIEMLGRHSPLKGLWFMLSRPATFCYNAILIFLTLSPSLFFRRRAFTVTLPAAVWLGLGIANCVTLFYRVMPLEAIDFAILRTGLAIWHVYMSVFQMGLIVSGLPLLIAGFVILWRKAPKKTALPLQALSQCLGAAVLLFGFGAIFQASGALTADFSDPVAAYDRNGFCYSLCTSLIDRGVDEPEAYSEQSVEEIVAAIADSENATPAVKPNIIFLQLESFFDPHYMSGYEYETNPVPVFSALKTRCSTGLLTVPGVGSGTANTEFEVLTGMSLDYFGAGEYPFQTILKEQACESLAWNLKEQGYGAHALHNHTGTFYDRNIVFASLGFDDFEPIEYMPGIRRNINGWALDSMLTDEIETALNSTGTPDFVYAISVQLHGKYPSEPLEGGHVIRVTGTSTEAEQSSLEYYLGQLHQVDGFLSSLVHRLSLRDEPTLVVLFGDHLPSLMLEEERFTQSTLFQTEYLIWANYDLPKEDRDLEAYQLGARVLEMIGMDNGLLTKLHQHYQSSPDYQATLEMLEYDMLYGEHIVYGGENPYRPTALRMGLRPVAIAGASWENGILTVTGEGFTESSRVRVGRDLKATEFVSASTLRAEVNRISEGDEIRVAQITDMLVELGETAPLLY